MTVLWVREYADSSESEDQSGEEERVNEKLLSVGNYKNISMDSLGGTLQRKEKNCWTLEELSMVMKRIVDGDLDAEMGDENMKMVSKEVVGDAHNTEVNKKKPER